ncbi:hypothetical protein K2173_001380 [Erythroxylum novogranatense]|uniref:GTD-binding domain-containing protein n=1 Tax=Erythroxylum novogranatense TaxID=1862640 RepID=A0AAV8T5D9_9ROSI|nr:hypothetical protein K2173_001380 [Erythroxylum novogranatense]
MAANKFASRLQRSTHKLTVILIYAVLEWILIMLLLLNSFFSYIITKFATYFGLKRPCLWCSRIDHVLEPRTNTRSYRELVCETHATEISRLGYCSSHQTLAEYQNMCVNCLASRPTGNDESTVLTRRIAFVSFVSNSTNTLGNDDKIIECSCCNESLNSDLYPPYLMFKPCWGDFKYDQKGRSVLETIEDENYNCKELAKSFSLAHYTVDSSEVQRFDEDELNHNDDMAPEEHQILSDVGSFGVNIAADEDYSRSESNLQCGEEEANEDQEAGSSPDRTEKDSCGMDFLCGSFHIDNKKCSSKEDSSIEIINLNLGRHLGCAANRLIPVELIDSSTTAKDGICNLKEDYPQVQDLDETLDFTLEIDSHVADMEGRVTEVKKASGEVDEDHGQRSSTTNFRKITVDAKTSMQDKSPMAGQSICTGGNNFEAKEEFSPAAEEENMDDLQLSADRNKSMPFEEFPDHPSCPPQTQESSPTMSCLADHSPTDGDSAEVRYSQEDYILQNESGPGSKEKTSSEGALVSSERDQERVNHHSLVQSEVKDPEDEKYPGTPSSVDSIQYLHKKLLLLEKAELGPEESLEGSVVSEMDSGDPVLTIERLKTALKIKQNSLTALYAELEEERNASAIAANQTMAMINRLQEEKAAMQMEALQYQRMMEEQSEYDQEALQLLNELMIKREKEKQELEKEVEVYRKKVMGYEAKDKMKNMRKVKDGSSRSRTSSATCSISEDEDSHSIDLNREAQGEDTGIYEDQGGNGNNTPPSDEVINLQEIALDCVQQMTALDDSLTEFEEERLSILDQLKALEEKLLNLGDKELIDDVNGTVDSSKEFGASYELSTQEEDDGISNENRPDRKTMGSLAKNLLPLLDAADEKETEEGFLFGNSLQPEFIEKEEPSDYKFESGSKRLAIEEEVDLVYERLQALEADREFLKHCMGSIKKGDKGMDLLQEILQHLRDLKAVELRTRHMSDEFLG